MKISKELNYNTFSTGIVAALLVFIAPTAFILKASEHFHLSAFETASWVFAVYTFSGIFGIVIPTFMKKPVVGGHSLAGMAFLTTVSNSYTFNELIGAFVMSSLLIIIIGLLGLFSKIMRVIPKEIIAAMLAGIITKYMIDFFISIEEVLIVGIIPLIVYFTVLKYRSSLNPVLISTFTAFILFFIFNPIGRVEEYNYLSIFSVQKPSIDITTLFSISIPLCLMILSNDIAVGLSGLRQNSYIVNENRLVTLSGIFSLITNFFGGQSANVAGMTTTLCSSNEAGQHDKRYIPAIVTGILVLMFGVFSSQLMIFISMLSSSFISFIVGLSLINVYINSLKITFFNNSKPLSAVFTFLIALSGIKFFGIGSPIIALVIGILLTRFLKQHDMGTLIIEEVQNN